MGKYDALLKKVHEVHRDLVGSMEELHKIESRFSDMKTQINSLERVKKDLDGRVMACLKVLVNPKTASATKVPEAASVHKYLQQLAKVEDGQESLGSEALAFKVYSDTLRVAQARQKTWYELMEDLVDKAKAGLKQEEDKTLRDGLRKIDWKKIKFGYTEPPVRK